MNVGIEIDAAAVPSAVNFKEMRNERILFSYF